MVRPITDTLRHLEAGCLIHEATGFMLLYGNAGL